MRPTSFLLLVLILFFSGCQQKARKYVVGVSQCSMDNWRDKFNDEFRTSALLTDSLTVLIECANDDDEQQKRQIEQFVDRGVDLIIVSPNQLKTISSALTRACDSGIPVILYDRKSGDDKYTAFIGCDNHQIGYAMGSYIAQRLGGRGRVAEIRGLEGSSPAIERHRGLADALAEYPGITLAASESGDWKTESGARAMKKIMQQTRDIDYVFAHNDRMAQGARREALSAGIGDACLFAGVDGLATDSGGLVLVRDGILDASYLYPTKGDEVAKLAMRILTRKPYDRENLLQASIVTAGNAELSLMEARDAERQREELGGLHRQVDSYISRFQAHRVITVTLVVILVLLVALVVSIYRALIVKARLNRQLDERNEKLRQLNEQVIEQTRSRLVFFTNISHELRTPLTLIIDPVEQIMTDSAVRGRSRELLALIRRNAVQLQQLVSTILDFRKIQNGKMTLEPSGVDLAAVLSRWVADFGPTAQRKRITLHVGTDAFSHPTIVTDEEKLSRIVFNLMSNALKYTPTGGRVFVTLADGPEEDRFSLSVRDTGKGIAPEDCPRVFDRFFQAHGAQAGTGVGLAVVKTYTELLHGTAEVHGNPGEGAEFIVRFPTRVTEACLPGHPVPCHGTEEETAPRHEACGAHAAQAAEEHQGGTVLVIDDNDDIRRYMRTILQPRYFVLEAADGGHGLETARREVPDLVVCDVMMPGIDGLGVCRSLKNAVATSHIPVIMLTAKALDEQRTEGYECGADSYITKPFNSRLLLARIDNLLRQRSLLRRRFAARKEESAAEEDTREQTFLRQLHAVIDRRLADSTFSVEQLGAEVGLSRVQLYRKVKALTGTSVVDLLRTARLTRARHLLGTSRRTISEVAYDTGFSSPSYFAKCFKEEYGLTPGEFLNTQA